MLPQRREIASLVVCEDDATTLELLCDHLVADGFGVLPAPSASDALRLCRFNHPDLLLLDLTLPDASGLDVLREIRESDGITSRFDPGLPVIVLSGRGGDADRVRGLDFGADDYLVKPFHFPELRARIGAVLRRGLDTRKGPCRAGEIVVDSARRKAWVGEREVPLSNKEFGLLRMLAGDPSRVFAKRELLEAVWGYRSPARTRHIRHTRRGKLRERNPMDPPVRGTDLARCLLRAYREAAALRRRSGPRAWQAPQTVQDVPRCGRRDRPVAARARPSP